MMKLVFETSNSYFVFFSTSQKQCGLAGLAIDSNFEKSSREKKNFFAILFHVCYKPIAKRRTTRTYIRGFDKFFTEGAYGFYEF